MAYENVVKGYEIAPGQHVVITQDELEALDPKKTRTIDIEDFVQLDEIDPVYYDSAYYLVPDRNRSISLLPSGRLLRGLGASPVCLPRGGRFTRTAVQKFRA